MSRQAIAAITLGAALLGAAGPAGAATFGFAGMHLAYGIGGAVGEGSGLRQSLDTGFTLGWMDKKGSGMGIGLGSSDGILLGASVITGFHIYPTYLALETGWGADTVFSGRALLVGPAVRVDPSAGVGAAARLGVDLFAAQMGVRLVGIAGPRAELQITFTIGAGRY